MEEGEEEEEEEDGDEEEAPPEKGVEGENMYDEEVGVENIREEDAFPLLRHIAQFSKTCHLSGSSVYRVGSGAGARGEPTRRRDSGRYGSSSFARRCG